MIHGTHNALDDPRNEKVWIYINDEFHLRAEAKISVFDSGYLVGDGIWEGIRLHHGKLVFKELHFDRLWNAAKTVGMSLPFSKQELEAKIFATLEKNQMKDGVHIRVMITRGNKKTPSQDPRLTVTPPNVVIIAEHKQADPKSINQGISLFTSTIRRGSPDYLDPKLNCHSKLHEVLALNQALAAGADEALMLDIHGFVSTCNATNFFMVKNEKVITSTGAYCMNGITRHHILQICRDHSIDCSEENFSLYDVYGADECFVTGTFGGLTPVNTIDGKVIGDGTRTMTDRLSRLYLERIEQEVSNA